MIRILLLLLLAAVVADWPLARAQSNADDYYAAINRYRSAVHSCAGAAMAPLPALKARTELEGVARDASQGENLAASLRGRSYRAARTALLGMTARNAASMMSTLTRQFCRELSDAAFTEMGLHRDKGRVWLVFAAGAPLPDPAEWKTRGRAVLELTNKARTEARQCGETRFEPAPPLVWNERLASAALAHSKDMALRSYFSHDAPDGSRYDERIRRAGYVFRAAGENIAAGQLTPGEALAGWLASPPHCANLMRREFIESGIAFAVDSRSSQGIYWTQTFGSPR